MELAANHRSSPCPRKWRRRRHRVKWEAVEEAAAMLFSSAVFYAVAWALAAMVR